MSGINKFVVQVPKNQQGIAATWGYITGTITNQTDLVTYIGTRLADYVPYTGATSNVNLGIYNLKTSKVSLGTTATDGFILENTTAATAGATVQISPRDRWRGSAWDTAGLASQTHDFTADILPVSQATITDAEWRLRSSFNGAAYVDRFGIKTLGNDTYLKIGGVNVYVKAGNTNGYLSGSTDMKIYSNNGGSIFATMLNSNGTWTFSPSVISGSAATASMTMTQTWNTSGAPDFISGNITNTASDVLSNLINLKVNTLTKFKITRRAVMTLSDDVINPSFNITGVSGNTMAFAADSAGGYVGSVNSIPFRILVQNGVFTPAVFGTNGDVGLGGNISNFTTMAGSVLKVLASGSLGIGIIPTASLETTGSIIGGQGFSMGKGLTNTSLGFGFGRNFATGAMFDSGRYGFQFTRPGNADRLDLEVYKGDSSSVTTRAMSFDSFGNMAVGALTWNGLFTVAQYTTGIGTVSNSAGGTTVTGVGTQFLNTFKVGDTITIGGQTVAITAVNSNTSLSTAAITGANSGVAYTLAGGSRFTVKGNGDTLAYGDVKLSTAGNGLYVKEGTNATMGRAVLVGGTVVVNTTKVTANSEIFLTNNVNGGTLGSVSVSARTAGTSFTITSTNILDTSTISWLIIEPS